MVRFLEEAHLAEEVQTGTEDGVREDLEVVAGPVRVDIEEAIRMVEQRH